MIRHAEAQWNGSIKEGTGHVKVETGALDSPYSFKSRFEGGGESNPEELLAASHAACFSMALSGVLTKDGIQADLFELCREEKKGRSGNMQVTLFKSVGTAIEDLAAAMLVWRGLN